MSKPQKERKTIDLGELPEGVRNFRASKLPDNLALRVWQDLPADSPIYQLVGRVASAWAKLEHTLDKIIWRLLEVPPARGACATAQMMGHAPRCDTIVALCKHHGIPKDIQDRVLAFKNALFDISTRRNRIVHDHWVQVASLSSEDNRWHAGQFKSMPRNEHVFGAIPSEIEFVTGTLAKIQEKAKSCLALDKTIKAALASLPGKPPALPPPSPQILAPADRNKTKL